MYRAFITLLLFILTISTAAAQTAPSKKNEPSKKTDSRRCVGVISVIGDKFTLKKVGITVFGNEEHTVSVEPWGLDDLVVNKVSALAGKRFNVRRINYPKGTFASTEDPRPNLFRNSNAEFAEIVRRIAAPQKCHRYVVVTKGGSQFGSSNQSMTGLGLVLSGGGLVDNSHLYALSDIHVFDGETFAVLARKPASIGQSTFMQGIRGPHREVDKSWWVEPGQAVQSTKLRDGVRALLGQSLEMTLPQVLSAE